MSIPRQAILDAVASKIKTIVCGQTVTMSDGTVHTYATTFDAGNVFEFGMADFPAGKNYAVFWRDPLADADDSENGRTLWQLDLSLVLLSKTGQTTQVRKVAQDILCALFSDKRLGNRLQTMTVRRLGEPKIERYEQLIGDLELVVTLHYRTKDWQI